MNRLIRTSEAKLDVQLFQRVEVAAEGMVSQDLLLFSVDLGKEAFG